MAEAQPTISQIYASIEAIAALDPIPGADNILKATILGWELVVKKTEFKVGDLAVFHHPDTVVDKEHPVYQQMPILAKKNFRLVPARIRGVVSQGLALPITSFTKELEGLELKPGVDVTARIKIIHYTKPTVGNSDNDKLLPWPSFLRKTDQPNLRSAPPALRELHEKDDIVITLKMDGTSSTFYHKFGKFGLCSRNYELQRDESKPESVYFTINRKYRIAERMTAVGRSMSLQGETVGPDVNGNRLKLKEYKFYAFHAWDLEKNRYLDYDDFKKYVEELNNAHIGEFPAGEQPVPIVWAPELWRGKLAKTIKELIDMANKAEYNPGDMAEGVVILPTTECYSPYLKERLSVKVISEPYELAYF